MNDPSAGLRLIKIGVDFDRHHIEIEVDTAELQSMVQGLQTELRKYPERPD